MRSDLDPCPHSAFPSKLSRDDARDLQGICKKQGGRRNRTPDFRGRGLVLGFEVV
jgi:hypothetical protein